MGIVQLTKTFRVFVSSTFSDLKEERNALQKHVFPKLQELCMKHGFRFQAIDLRWGVSEEAGLDQQTMKICLEEIKRSQKVSPKPNFIVLLGDRYGWIPLPYEIPADEFEEIKKVTLNEDDRKFLFWEGNLLDDEQLKKREGWYCLDKNADPPVYCLKSRVVENLDNASDDEIINAKAEEARGWFEIEEKLKKILVKAIEELGWDENDPRRQKYETSATEQEIINGVLNVPSNVPDVKDHVFCFFREIKNLEDVKNSAKYLIHIPRNEFHEIVKNVEKYEKELLTSYYELKGEFYFLNLDKQQFSPNDYNKTLHNLNHALINGVRRSTFDEDVLLNKKIKEKYLACDFIDILNECNDRENVSYDVFDKLAYKKLQHLKSKLKKELPNNINTYSDQWKGGLRYDHVGTFPPEIIRRTDSKGENEVGNLCVDVWNQLYNVIMGEINKNKKINSLDQEIMAHKTFGKDRSRFFIGRDENLRKIKNYLKNPNSKPLVVYGDSGSGKSALMAKALEDLSPYFYEKTEPKDNYHDGIIVRFIGATPESSDLRSLIYGLCRQISKIYELDESNIPSEYNELVHDFASRLNFAIPEKPLIIFLDALDQLSDFEAAHNLIWLPEVLPANVHIVLSTLKVSFKSYLKNKVTNEDSNEVCPLEKDEGKLLLSNWLKNEKVGRKLTTIQENEVINKFKTNGMPLYLKLAFEEARKWKSYTPTPRLASDIPGIIRQMFARLSKPENHGEILVSHSLGYLEAAKNGLTEDEMLDILAEDREVFSLTKKFHQPPEEKLPVALWSRLYFDLEPYLTERSADDTSLISFYHRQLGEVAQEEYLNKEFKKTRHKVIAEYFYKKDLLFEKEDKIDGKREKEGKSTIIKERTYDIRKVSELPYQEVYGECWEHLEKTLCDLHFIEAKCAVGMIYELINDYNLALEMHPDAQEEKKKQLEHKKRVDKYVKDLIAYSEGKIEDLDVIQSLEPWTEDKIQKENERIIRNPEPLDRIKSFLQFINSQSHNFALLEHLPRFCLQQAYNSANSGPVAESAFKIIKKNKKEPFILRKKSSLPQFNLHSDLINTLEGHHASVNTVAITPDAKTAITGSHDGTVFVWNLKTGEQIQKLKGQDKFVDVLTITLGQKTAMTGNHDGTAHKWDLRTGKQLKKLKCQIKGILSFADDGKTVFTGGHDTIFVWDFETGKKLRKLKRYLLNVESLSFTPDAKIAITGISDGTVFVWNLKTGEQIQKLKGHNKLVNMAVITPDAKTAITHSEDNQLLVWDLETAKSKKLEGHNDQITTLAITPDAKTAITGSGDNTVRIWDLKTCKSKKLEGHTKSVNTVAITPDAKTAITGSRDGTGRVWNLQTGKSKKLEGHTKSVNTLAITPDAKTAITGSSFEPVILWDLETGNSKKLEDIQFKDVGCITIRPDGKTAIIQNDDVIELWNLKTGKKFKELKSYQEYVEEWTLKPFKKKKSPLHNFNIEKTLEMESWRQRDKRKNELFHVNSLNSTPDGKTAIMGFSNGIVRVWDVENGGCILLEGHIRPVNAVAVTPDAKTAITGSDDGNAEVWNLENGKSKKLEGHDHIINAVAITPDAKTAITGSFDKTARIWNLETGRSNIFEDRIDHVNAAAITPDGKTAITKKDKMLQVWNLETGEKLKELKDHTDYLNPMIITPNGKTAITGSGGNNVRIWNLENGKSEKIKSQFEVVVISPDSKIAISNGYDKTVQLWNLHTGTQLKELIGHYERLRTLTTTPDGKTTITASYDKTVRIWDLETCKQLKEVKDPEIIDAVAITPDGKIAIIGGRNNIGGDNVAWKNSLWIWNLETGGSKKLGEDFKSLDAVAITPDAKTAITGSDNNTIRIWNLKTGKSKKINVNLVKDMDITPDAKTAITGSRDGTVHLLNLKTNESSILGKHHDRVNTVAITPDAKTAITGSDDNTIRIWNLKTGNFNILKGHAKRVNTVAITPDAKTAITGSDDNTIRIWNLKTGKSKKIYHQYIVYSLALSSDGNFAITGDMGGALVWNLKTDESEKLNGHFVKGVTITPDRKTAVTISDRETIVWNLKLGEQIKKHKRHPLNVEAIVVNPDGKTIITKNGDESLSLWDIETGKEIKKLEGHKKRVKVAAVTPDGKTAITGGDDHTLRIWNLETGRSNILKGHNEGVNTVAVTADGKTAITGCDDHTLRIWNLEKSEMIFLSKEESPITFLTLKADGSFVFGNSQGIFVSKLVNIPLDVPLITTSRRWLFGKNSLSGSWDDCIKADCQWCGKRFKVTVAIQNIIKETENKYKKPNGWISDEAWKEPGLLSECPECQGKIRFNPFIVDNKK